MKRSELSSLPSYLKEALPVAVTSMNHFFMQPAGQANVEVVNVKSEPLVIDEDEEGWIKNIEQPSSSKSTPKRLHSQATTPAPSASKKPKSGTSDDQNEDVAFFKSLLPDVARMSCHQKLKFKQEALSIIEDILYASEDLSTQEQMTV